MYTLFHGHVFQDVLLTTNILATYHQMEHMRRVCNEAFTCMGIINRSPSKVQIQFGLSYTV